MKTRLPLLMTIILSVIPLFALKAQETPFITHYYDLPSLYNPASAGMQKTLKIAVDGRLDSIGQDSKGRNIIAIAEGGMDFEKIRIGAGMIFGQETVSSLSRMTARINIGVGYRIGAGILSVGISPGILRGEIAVKPIGSGIPDDDVADGSLSETNEEGLLKKKTNTFDVALGVSYSDSRVWLSASLLHLNDPKFHYRRADNEDDESLYIGEETVKAAVRTFYFSAGYNITIKKSLFDMIPSFIVAASGGSMQFQADARLVFKNLIHFGLGWRSKNTGIVMAGIEYKGFHLAYGYEHGFSTTDGGRRFQGHELLAWYSVNLDLNKKKKHVQKSIRIL